MAGSRFWRRARAKSVLLILGISWGWAGGALLVPWLNRSQPDLEIPLAAVGATTSDRFAVATGPVDDEVEGMFVLDYETGELQCLVLNVRTSKFGAVFRTNVLQDLGTGARKNARFALTTGEAHFARAGRVARVARSVAYVVDPTTGVYGAYALQWRPEIAASGRTQTGQLVLLDTGQLSVPVGNSTESR